MRIRTTYQMLVKQHKQALVAQSIDAWITELEQVTQIVNDLLGDNAIQENVNIVSKLQKIKFFLESL